MWNQSFFKAKCKANLSSMELYVLGVAGGTQMQFSGFILIISMWNKEER